MQLTQQNKTDLLEVVIILALFFLIVVIYVPVAIWEEEAYYEKESRYRMQNAYDIESFYSRLTGEYNPNFLEALMYELHILLISPIQQTFFPEILPLFSI